jgi:hypothetical protein
MRTLGVRASIAVSWQRGMRSSAALILCMVHLALPALAGAGSPRHVPRGAPVPHVRGVPPVHGGMPVMPGPPKGAFGSPGGYPLSNPAARQGVASSRFAHRFPRHVSFSSWAPPLVFWGSGIQYAPAVEAAPPIVHVAPVIYAAPTIYVSPPAITPPDPVTAAAPPELTRVVEHATGRYELRGDGTSTPYVWVWVPHPPPAPPESAPSTEPGEAPIRSTGRTPAYRWTDENGTIFVTNRFDQVPEPYRSRAPEPAP